MKAFLVASIALIASANAALAGDLGPTVTGWPFEAPPAYPTTKMYDWSGFYIGLNGGGALGDINWTSVPDATSGTANGNGGLFGGTAGYNLQTGERYVVGLEADIDWSGISGTVSTAPPAAVAAGCSFGGANNCEFKIPWLATARLRFGYSFDAFTPVAIMPYVTGGVAITRLNADIAGAPYGWEGQNTLGWTVGGGVEVAITGEWRAKVEYLYMDLNGFSCSSSCAFPGDGSVGPISFNYTASIVRAGLNYRLWTP